jgi:hypothetical protein
VRVEGFIQFLIDHHKWAANPATTNSRAEGYLRGLESTDEYPLILKQEEEEKEEKEEGVWGGKYYFDNIKVCEVNDRAKAKD